jgi:hypothetical protein
MLILVRHARPLQRLAQRRAVEPGASRVAAQSSLAVPAHRERIDAVLEQPAPVAARLDFIVRPTPAMRAWMTRGRRRVARSRNARSRRAAARRGSTRRCVCNPGYLRQQRRMDVQDAAGEARRRTGDRMRMKPASTISDGERSAIASAKAPVVGGPVGAAPRHRAPARHTEIARRDAQPRGIGPVGQHPRDRRARRRRLRSISARMLLPRPDIRTTTGLRGRSRAQLDHDTARAAAHLADDSASWPPSRRIAMARRHRRGPPEPSCRCRN